MKNEILIVAAEASSGLFAQRLLEKMQSQKMDFHAFGVGTKDMENLGFERLGKSEEMAVVGASEIFAQFGLLKSVFDQLVESARVRKPKFAIVMDYPEFNLFLSRKLHALGIPVFYYISPQVWKWRKGRVHTIKKFCKKVFLLFPFEVDFYSKFDVPYNFVGHPLLDELDANALNEDQRKLLKTRLGLQADDVVLGIMPGSRRMEIRNLFAIELEAAKILWRKNNRLKIVILCAPTVEKEFLLPYLEDFRIPFLILKDDPFKMVSVTDYVIAASGTATLIVGLLKKPMVIVYKVSWLTGWFAKTIIGGMFGLPNLIAKKEIVPELFQSQVNPVRIAAEIEKFMTDDGARREVIAELSQLWKSLGDRGATDRVLAEVKPYLDSVNEST